MLPSEICKLGARRYFQDRGVYRNPYPPGTVEFDEFERGWMQSLKRDNGRLIGETEKAQGQGKTPQPAGTSALLEAERYRSRKG
jgi:hypothetical protein